MRCVVAVVSDPHARRRLKEALGGEVTLRFTDDVSVFLRAARGGKMDVAVLEVGNGQGFIAAPVIAELRRGFPYLAIVVYAPLRPSTSAEIATACRAGADTVVIAGHDDLGQTVGRLVADADERHQTQFVSSRVAAFTPAELLPAVQYCFRQHRRPLSVTDVAVALGVTRRTLFNRFARAGWPPPSTVAAWCRLLIAARLLEEPGTTVRGVSARLGFPSLVAFRLALRRHTGLSPTALRTRGLSGLLEMFRASTHRPARRTAA